MTNTGGFWSYVHADDDADGGRIGQLAEDLKAQYEAITAEPLDVFLDRTALKWGDDWVAKVDSALAGIAFFIPVVTPRYFRSPECRRELQTFARHATALGFRDLVLPVVYIDVPALHEPEPVDDAVALVKTYQWEDWRNLRFEDRASREYRLAVAGLAQRLADVNQQLAVAGTSNPSSTSAPGASLTPEPGTAEDADPQEDDGPGDLDLMAVAEETLPRWSEVIQSAVGLLGQITEAAEDASAGLDRSDREGKGFAGRLFVTRRLAARLKPLAERMLELGNDYTAHMYRVDPGVRAMVRAGALAAEDETQRKDVCDFFNSVLEMSTGAREGLNALQAMVDSMTPIESLSRELRPVLRQLRQGLTMMIEGQSVTDEWARLVEASGVDCSGAGT